MKYLIKFDRIGRNHMVEPLIVDAAGPDDLLGGIDRYALKYTASRSLDIFVNTTTGRGEITAGFQSAGTFTVTEVADAT